MAIFLPDLEQIRILLNKKRERSDEGVEAEAHLLEFLRVNLDDSYEVYFQSYLNGINPDVVIMRKGSGVMIIEVKDWNLNNYNLDEKNNWLFVDKNGVCQKKEESPLQQVRKYKDSLFDLHIERLLEKKIKDQNYFAIVNCVVYFHKATKKQIDDLLAKDDVDNGYIDLIGFDNLTSENFKRILSKRWLDKKSRYFDDDLYSSFRRYLKPPLHTVEQGKAIIYSDEQKRVIESGRDWQQKVRGVAGSGKTTVLAKRAVNAFKRHGDKVLILTYNISLKNYIHDKISEVREQFEWKNFIVLNYHQFINEYNKNPDFSWNDENSEITTDGLTFQTIIIDEIQDYEKKWISNVKKFLAKDGEFIVFGDEKQNIYARALEAKKPYTGIPGQWNILKKSFRLTSAIADLTDKFQSFFFKQKYYHDELVQGRLFDRSTIKYFCLDDFDIDKVIDIYDSTIKELDVHDNDVCFLSSTVEVLRNVDRAIRDKFHKRTNTMFETSEIYEKLKQDFLDENQNIKKDSFEREIDKVRRNKKYNFWMNSGTTKLSTVHSFKGWEVQTLFLLIETTSDEAALTDELIYTAITRCRQNLIVINLGNKRYDIFFRENIAIFT